ncbi:hypothetical protein WJ972_14500 [Achromobacter insuavis]
MVALYSGNMGGKQGLQTLAQVARLLQHEPRLWFVFCGQGTNARRCRRSARAWRGCAFSTCSRANAWARC